ncbi:multimerin-2 [Elgaria multicarinata webbii]|uniref:multimerin-2 n=1 Tax=Elgaria multicarinata webbii TaxID=159646 RepID=UPI002FCD4130
MIAKILLLCSTIGLAHSERHSRYPGYHHHKQREQNHRTPTNPQPSSMPEGYWQTELVGEETLNQASTIVIETDDYDIGNHQSRKNWCSFIQSRLVTYAAACKTEKYVIKSQQPCPNGTPECQKIMYRVALKPVYQIKQKVITSLHWKCCSGYIGKNCEYHEPNFLQEPTKQPGGWEEKREAFSSQREALEVHQSHEAVLADLQNDIHQATSNLGSLQNALQPNINSTSGEENHKQSDAQEQFLQRALLPHMESFLKEHLNPVWTSFNKSLQDLSIALKNLSQNVAANRKSIERFQESTVPRKDFQELGTKFESKVQANVLKVDQMKREIESHLHLHQAAIHYNLTMIKADTDMKLKRHHKIQHIYWLALNSSVTDIRQEQNKRQDELETLNRNLAGLLIRFGSQKEVLAETDVQFLNRTLAGHTQQLKYLFEEFDDYKELTDRIESLRISSLQDIGELRVALMEKSLIIEEYRVDLERKILALNNTLGNVQESYWELQSSMKACHCENLPSGIGMEDEANATKVNREEMKQLEAHLKDLAAAFPLIHQSLDFQQEQSRKLEGGMSLLKSHTESLSENIGILKRNDEKMHGHIKYLNSSFSSLLVDAMRHERALEALLGEEIMEALSEDDPGTSLSSLQVMTVGLISDSLQEQNSKLESLMKRIRYLEMVYQNNPNTHKSPEHPVPEKQAEDTVQEISTQHGRVEDMEPNHEAAVGDALDNPAYHDLMTLKKDIGNLSREMKKYSLQWDHIYSCCNQTKIDLVETLSISMGNLKEDLESTQQSFEEHLQIFQKLFGSHKELAAANVTLNVAKIQSLMGRMMRKQLKGQKLRDTKDPSDHREGTLNGRNKIHTEILETGTAVAFYVRYPDEREQEPSPNGTHLNYGDGYSPEQGYFKTPHSGVYMVAISVELPPGPALGQLAFSNGRRMALTGHKKRKANGSSVTTFALVELKKGERMWFELVQGGAVTQNPAGSSMAGFLIVKT